MITALTRKVIRADGTEELLDRPHTMREINALIKGSGTDTVSLRDAHTHVLIVDDLGHAKGSPINDKATQLYWSVCRPGTKHVIRGDVVIAPDHDFGSLL